ncbi:MAG: anhydro-N-acetylmuramic acid kinase [Elusimicrobiaceae bacterium]|nr:anhydro-N-acetylmuramic acid kinase [Elusimicrobiaceae bacterium]
MHKLVLGLMSGTSADGLTICAIYPKPFQIIHCKNYPYEKIFQQKLLTAYKLTASQLSKLHYQIGIYYAQTVKKFLKDFHLSSSQIAAIGMHGQTIYHGPQDTPPNTLQIGEPSFLAVAFHVPVVSDFRAMDMALGGQGAPLIPFFDQYVFGQKSPKMLLNIGGISNLSVIGKNSKIIGFDCGPGNTLIDLACQHYFKKPFDKNGALAAKGTPDKTLVNKLLKQKFFNQKPPKSLDKNTYGFAYLKKYFPIKNSYDLLATLTYFTAACIAQNIFCFVPKPAPKELIISGGGFYNKTLMRFLQELLPLVKITTSAAHGIDPQAKEAAAFALFAWLCLQHKTNHCASATGARKNAILGKVTYA